MSLNSKHYIKLKKFKQYKIHIRIEDKINRNFKATTHYYIL